MSSLNKEMQLRKTCELYSYLLTAQGKEVPDEIQESLYFIEDYPVNCVAELSEEVKSLDSQSFEKIVNNKDVQAALDLAYWWKMYKEVDRLHGASLSEL